MLDDNNLRMKKHFILFVVLLITNTAFAQMIHKTHLGTLAVLSVDLNKNDVELEVPVPPEGMFAHLLNILTYSLEELG